MATFKVEVIRKIREDKTYRLRVRVTHQRKNSYIPTDHYVTRHQLDKNFNVKDSELLLTLLILLEKFRKKSDKLSSSINQLTVRQLCEYLAKDDQQKTIDFIKWSRGLIDQITVDGTRSNGYTTLNSFIDFVGPSLDINEVSYSMLKKYEDYVRGHRIVKRVNNPGKPPVSLKLKPMKNTGIHDYMAKLKGWFEEAMKHHNRPGNIVIQSNPFDLYEAPGTDATEDKVITIQQLYALMTCGKVEVGKYKRTRGTELAQDVAILSFYLMGMNAVDLYQVDKFNDGRIGYNRAKTASRREDKAYISISIPPEAEAIFNKYRDPSGERVFIFHKLYTHHDGLTKAVNDGLKAIGAHLKWKERDDISLIWIRHTWGTIARNDCEISKDTVAECLNHSDPDHKVTDIYIARTWKRIDAANRVVIDYLFSAGPVKAEEVTRSVA